MYVYTLPVVHECLVLAAPHQIGKTSLLLLPSPSWAVCPLTFSCGHLREAGCYLHFHVLGMFTIQGFVGAGNVHVEK